MDGAWQDIKSRADIKHEKSAIKKAKAAVARETKKAAAAQKSVEDAEASIPELLAAVEAQQGLWDTTESDLLRANPSPGTHERRSLGAQQA